MTTTALVETLGGARVYGEAIKSSLGWIDALENGLPVEAVDAAIERGILSRREVDEYVIPRRSLSRRKQKCQRLTPEESDKLCRITRITARAAETLNTQEDASAWLREPNGALAGRAPLDLLRSGEGAILVEQILGRIDHGVYT
jgi:putative toxin-antitoxin system antitoxin component (TIGR02293 family)